MEPSIIGELAYIIGSTAGLAYLVGVGVVWKTLWDNLSDMRPADRSLVIEITKSALTWPWWAYRD